MVRGINRSNLFLDSKDFYKMSKILKTIAKPTEINGEIKEPVCSIYAYCLMTNHLHLLISENKETISDNNETHWSIIFQLFQQSLQTERSPV